MTPLLTSKSQELASEAQARRVRTLTSEAIEVAAIEGCDFTNYQLQTVHAYAGPFKEEFKANYLKFLQEFCRRPRGIIIPAIARNTGLIPKGWSVGKDEVESQIDLETLDFSRWLDFGRSPGQSVSGGSLFRKANYYTRHYPNIIGSLGFAQKVLELQSVGVDVLPPNPTRHSPAFVLPFTNLIDEKGVEQLALLWGEDRKWTLKFMAFNNANSHFDFFVIQTGKPQREEEVSSKYAAENLRSLWR